MVKKWLFAHEKVALSDAESATSGFVSKCLGVLPCALAFLPCVLQMQAGCLANVGATVCGQQGKPVVWQTDDLHVSSAALGGRA